MNEIITDLWALLLPEEWHAEQDEETVIITDEDEVSLIEITPLLPESGSNMKALLASLSDGKHKTLLAELTAYYEETTEDEMFWREWYCDAGNVILVVSHGCDIRHKHYDDATIDEILSTLALVKT